MADDRLEAAVDAALAVGITHQRGAREAVWASPSRDQVRAMIRAQFDRAEAAEARAAAERERITVELKEYLAAFLAHHGNASVPFLAYARDMAEGVRQILDRVPLGGAAGAS